MIERREISEDERTRVLRLHEQVIALWNRAREAPRYLEQNWTYFVALSPLGTIEGLLGMPCAIGEEPRRNAQAMSFTDRSTRLARMLHVLWTIACDADDYNKAEWRELEHLCGIGYPDPELMKLLLGIVAAQGSGTA